MFQDCPYGGKCIDPGNPTDCEVNSRCFNFNSAKEKAEFDNLPDLIVVKSQGAEFKFKNKTQLKFFLTDFKGNWEVSMLVNDKNIPVNVDKLLD
jgi:hypothetical protein